MEINDELIASYIEGKCSIAERQLVREYLSMHPEEHERMLYLMDEDKECDVTLNDTSSVENFSIYNSYSDVAIASAAFAPLETLSHNMKAPKQIMTNNVNDRLANMCDELDI